MTKEKEITLTQIWRDILRKGIPILAIFIFGGIGKAAWDVYAYSKLNEELHNTVKANEIAVRGKANQTDLVNLQHKVDKILIGLCMINKKTCRLRDRD